MRQALVRCQYDFTACDTFTASMRFDHFVSNKLHFRPVIAKFLKLLRRKYDPQLWFRTEHTAIVPHIHVVWKMPLGSDFDEVAKQVRIMWCLALHNGGVPLTGQRTWVGIVKKTEEDVKKYFCYLHKTNRGSISAKDSRPRGWKGCQSISRKWCDAKSSPVVVPDAVQLPEVVDISDWVEVSEDTEVVPVPEPVTDTSTVESTISDITLNNPSLVPGGWSYGADVECNITNGHLIPTFSALYTVLDPRPPPHPDPAYLVMACRKVDDVVGPSTT